MRGIKGKLICVWSPVLHGEGCSTLACGVGFAMHYLSGKRTIIVNKSNCTSHMEKYVERDIEIKYSMDNLKIFNTGLRTDHLMTYATQVNTGLYMLGGSRFSRDITKEADDFDRLFIDNCLEGFDIVVADMDTGIRDGNSTFLEAADIILAVFTPNDIAVDELFSQPALQGAREYFSGRKTIGVLNKLYDGWDADRIESRYRDRYSMSRVLGMNYDGDVINACCLDRNFYSFLLKELKQGKGSYVKQLNKLCGCLLGELHIEEAVRESARYGGTFRRLLRSSLY